MYSTRRYGLAVPRKLLYMTTAFFSAPSSVRDSLLTMEEPMLDTTLGLQLDFRRSSLPARTRMSHPHILFSPVHYEPNYAYPLLIWLHGSGENERQLTRIMPIISMRNYVAVAPRGLLTSPAANEPAFDLSVASIINRSKDQYDWPCVCDLQAIEQRVFDCIAVAQERCNIADHRIFIAGFGTGGTAALQLATQFPESFAGVAAFGCVDIAANSILPSWQMAKPFSVLLGVDASDSDRVCRMLELFYTAGFTANVQEYDNATVLTPEMLRNLNHWAMNIVCR